jgi:hypothetical protein
VTLGQFTVVPVKDPVVLAKSITPQVYLKHGTPLTSAGPEKAVPFWIITAEINAVPVQEQLP